MKNFTLILIAFSLFCFACGSKKDNPQPQKPDLSAKVYPVNFSVSSFITTFDKLAAVDPSIGQNIDYMSYQVFNNSGVMIRQIQQYRLSSSNFGSIGDSLPSGNYTAVFVGKKGVAPIFSTNSSLSSAYFYNVSDKPVDDTFYKKINFAVGTALLNQNVVLDRIVGQAKIVIEDAIPSNISKLSFLFQGELQFYYYAQTYYGTSNVLKIEVPLTNEQKGKAGLTFSYFILNTQSKVNVAIRAFSNTDALSAEKLIPEVQFFPNTTTVLSGNLFKEVSNTSQSVFNISLNNTWNTTENIVKY